MPISLTYLHSLRRQGLQSGTACRLLRTERVAFIPAENDMEAVSLSLASALGTSSVVHALRR